ncbi:serine/threonine-protein phosphatase 4 regulatory subunit 2 isoform X2 [Hemicordylus capensis]|uniref:serine/threonine-protein phosphatase 4 regulatory subunit 2 isoform X2 n=1 Tax=Hemicordylus capensis TaxID=884348 RepID=UPI0023024B40|nr:serine/threonine-protein phosphatase 4 regulatory subunit 2 isoform X2 [Hemicordylus capensis]
MDVERLQEALKDFEKRGKKEVCPILDQFLCHVAKTGETMIHWSQFKGYFIFKLEKVMDDFRTSAPEPRGPPNPNVEYIPFEEMKERILKIVTGFNGIPFTIQRLCELLTDPRRNYTGTDKFLRGVEKNVMVVSCVYPSSEKNSSNSLNRMNGVMFPGNSPGYPERSNINGPGTPRPVNRPKVSLTVPMTTNGLPDSPENKESGLPQEEEKINSESPAADPERIQSSPVKNKHPEDDPAEVEGHEVKRLKFDKEEESEETTSQSSSSEACSAMVEETETTSPSQDKEKETICERQRCKEEEEEEEESLMTPKEIVPERKDQDKDNASLTVKEDISEENNQMEESDQTQAEKDLPSEDSENSGSVSSRADCSETEELGSYASETPESASEIPMENSNETTNAAEEPMEQD